MGLDDKITDRYYLTDRDFDESKNVHRGLFYGFLFSAPVWIPVIDLLWDYIRN